MSLWTRRYFSATSATPLLVSYISVSPVSRTASGKVSHHLSSKGWVCGCHMLHTVSTRIYTAVVENVSAHRAWWWGPSVSLSVYLTIALQRKALAQHSSANSDSPLSWKCVVFCVCGVHAQDQAVISLQQSFFGDGWLWSTRESEPEESGPSCSWQDSVSFLCLSRKYTKSEFSVFHLPAYRARNPVLSSPNVQHRQSCKLSPCLSVCASVLHLANGLLIISVEKSVCQKTRSTAVGG